MFGRRAGVSMQESPPAGRPREPGSDLRRDALALAVLALLPMLVFLREALLRRVFFAYDVQHYFYPYHEMPAALVTRGVLPLWNPYVFSGIPLMGDGQTALFYPPNWLFFLLPPAAALNYDILAQFSLAGVGMYLFARSLRLCRVPSFLGAVAYMFSGVLSARIVHLSIMSGAALLPLVFFCIERTLQAAEGGALRPGSERRWLVASAAAVAAQFLTGHPQVPIYTALAVGIYVLPRIARSWRNAPGRWLAMRPAMIVAGAFMLGACAAAIQLVPWFETGRESVRAVGAGFDFVFEYSVGRTDWLLQLFPYLRGAVQVGPYADTAAAMPLASRIWEHFGYIGYLPLGLAAWAILDLRRPDAAVSPWRGAVPPLAAILFVGLLLAAGRSTPLAHVTLLLPGLGKLRAVGRALVLVDFAVAGLAALGLQRLSQRAATQERRADRRLLVVSSLVAAVPAGIVLLASQPWFQRAWHLPPESAEYLQPHRPNALVPVAFAILSAALLAWWARNPVSRLTGTIAVLLVLLDVGGVAATFTPTADSDYFARRPESLAALAGEPGTFRKATFLPSNDVDDDVARESLAMSWGMVFGVEDVNGFNSLQTRRYTDYLFGKHAGDVSYGMLGNDRLLRAESPILHALNVRYLFVPAGAQPRIGSGFTQRFENRWVRVYENESAYPRAYFARRVRGVADPSVVLAAVTADGFDGRSLALIEGRQPPLLPEPGDNDTVTVTSWSPNAISLQTTSGTARFLVLSEMYAPGWRATVDGVETPVYRANYLFRGIAVPAGQHSVRFDYEPSSVLWGALVSAIAAVVGLWLLASPRNTVKPASTQTGGKPDRAVRLGS